MRFTVKDISWDDICWNDVADDLATSAATHPDAFTRWEREFLASVHLCHYLTDKQIVALANIALGLGSVSAP